MALFKKCTQKSAIEYLSINKMVTNEQLTKPEYRIIQKLMQKRLVVGTHKNIGMWSSAAHSWTEFTLVDPIEPQDELYTLEDYDK